MQTPGIGPRPRVRLTKERIVHKWSQRELANLVDTTSVNISRWERGLTRPGPYFREKLCALFGKSEQELDLEALEDWVASKISELPDTQQGAINRAPTTGGGSSQQGVMATGAGAINQAPTTSANTPLYDPLIPRRSALSLVGRDAELDQLRQRLCSGQSVALTALNGLPGVGKTALSIALVQDEKIRAYFRDGILWAGLGPHPNIPSMLSRWEKLLEVPDTEITELSSNEARARAIRTALGTRRMLLVIDDAWSIENALLFKVGGPHCVHLVTTRFPALATHFAPDGAVGIRELGTEDSMKLLQGLAPDVIQQESQKAQDLISAVGGLPLALTLIGNYLRKQSHSKQHRRIHAALERLSNAEERLHLHEPQEPAEAHSSLASDERLSLQSVFSVTDHQLGIPARHALYALSVFPPKPNTFSEEAALAVANCSADTLDLLSDAGLLESSDNSRYTLHQTISDYACLQLKDASASERLITYTTTYVEAHEKDYDLLEQESHLILATLDTAYAAGKHTYLIRAALAFTPYLLSRGLYPLAKQHLQHAHAAAQEQVDTSHIPKTLLYLGRIAQKQGEYAQAESHFQDGLALARQLRDRESICSLLTDLGNITWRRGDYATAEAYLQEGLALAREIAQSRYLCIILEMLGSIAGVRGNYTESETYLQEGLLIARRLEDREQVCSILSNLGTTIGEQGYYAQSKGYLQEGLELARQIGHREWICGLLSNLGSVCVEQEQFAQAETYFREGIILARQLGQREWISMLLLNLGLTTRKLKDYQRAQAYLEEGLVIARQLGVPQITATSLYEYGNLHVEQKQLDEAETTFHEMLNITPAGSQDLLALAQYGLARTAAAQGKLGQAIQLGEASLTILDAIGHRNVGEVKAWLHALVK